MGTRQPRRDEYMPHCFAVRLAVEPDAHRYLDPTLAALRGGHWVQPLNTMAFVYVTDLADACRLVLSCTRLRLIGTNAHDFPVPPAEHGGEHYTVRLTIAVEGGRDDPRNRAMSAHLGRVGHRFSVARGRLEASGVLVVRMHLPTLRHAVDLVRACPHLRLVADSHSDWNLR